MIHILVKILWQYPLVTPGMFQIFFLDNINVHFKYMKIDNTCHLTGNIIISFASISIYKFFIRLVYVCLYMYGYQSFLQRYED